MIDLVLSQAAAKAKLNTEVTASQLASRPLLGVICLVETVNDDGTIASASNAAVVQELGGKVVNHLSERLTHYVCSNPTPKRLLAAKLLKIQVVSPLWIEQSRALNKRAPEKDFAVTSPLLEIVNRAIHHPEQFTGFKNQQFLPPPPPQAPVQNPLPIPEPIPNRAAMTRSINSPFFSSSQRDSIVDFPRDVEKTKKANDNKVDSVEDPFARPVPIPCFREYKPPEITDTSTLSRRRSERLIDLDEDDDSDENNEFVKDLKANKTSLSTPSLKEVMSMAKTKVLPVVYVNESAEESLAKFKKSLVEESWSDQERRRLRAEADKKRQKDSKKHGSASTHQSSSTLDKTKLTMKSPPASTSSSSSSSKKIKTEDKKSSSTTKSGSGKDSTDGSIEWRKHVTYELVQGILTFRYETPPYKPTTSSKSKIIIALTGFDKQSGEYDTMYETIQSILNGIAKNKADLGNQLNEEDDSFDPYETSVEVLHEDSVESHSNEFTHLVVKKDFEKRTLRVLFAIARNAYIVNESWIYEALCHGKWANPNEHRIHRYSHIKSGIQSLKLLRNKLFCLLHSTKPEKVSLIQLIEAAGGRVTTDIMTDEKINYFLVGDREDFKDWVLAYLKKNDKKTIITVKESIEGNNVHLQLVTSKFVCNCLEEQNLRYGLKREEEALTHLDVLSVMDEMSNLLKDKKFFSMISSKRAQSATIASPTIKQDPDAIKKKNSKLSKDGKIEASVSASASKSSMKSSTDDQQQGGIFKNKYFCFLQSRQHQQADLQKLIEENDGTLLTNIYSTENRIHYFLVGDRDDFKDWLLSQDDKTLKDLKYTLENTKVQIITLKFLENVSREGTLRYALKKNDESLSHIDFQEILTANGKQISASGKAVLLTSPVASPPPKVTKVDHHANLNKQEIVQPNENFNTVNNDDGRSEFQVLTANRPEKRKDAINLVDDDTPKKKAKKTPGNDYQKVYGRKLNEPRSSLSSIPENEVTLPHDEKQSLDTWANSNDYFSVNENEEKREEVVRSDQEAKVFPSPGSKEPNPSIFKFFNNWFQTKEDAASQEELYSRTSNTQTAASSLVMLANTEKTQILHNNNQDSETFHSVNNSLSNSPKKFIIKSPVKLAAQTKNNGWEDDYEELVKTPDDFRNKSNLGGRLRKSGSLKSSKPEERFMASPPALGRVGRPD